MAKAIAFQLAAALENYQLQVDGLANPRSQAAQYGLVSTVFDEVRMLKGAFPQLSVHMVEVVIRHVELMETLWRLGHNPARNAAGAVQEARRKHRDAVDAMHQRCLRVFSRRT